MSGLRTVAAWACGVVLAISVVLLEVAIALSSTVLNPAFVSSQLADLELHPLVAAEAEKRLPPEYGFMSDLIAEAAPELEAWAHEQLATVVYAAGAYLKGEGELRAVVSLEEPKLVLATHIEAAARNLTLPLLQFIPADQRDAFLALMLKEMDNRIPDQVEIDETYLGADTVARLHQARQYVAYVIWLRRLLPVVCLLAIIGIAAACSWQIAAADRYVGAALGVAGLIALVVALVARSRLTDSLPAGIPEQFLGFVPGFIADCCRPLILYGVVTLVVGVGLVLLSLDWKRRKVESS
ncbi:MAG: hypothetical protein M0R22_03495 [Dehalococcoidia bacterium]|jgi:hypothetical protein|nr:hypothetical protein [Dehalococcoidia bacterium]